MVAVRNAPIHGGTSVTHVAVVDAETGATDPASQDALTGKQTVAARPPATWHLDALHSVEQVAVNDRVACVAVDVLTPMDLT